jgi:branched-chain amino acid transport system substrate-binding protein
MRRAWVGLLLLGTLLKLACGSKKLIVGVVLPETGVDKGYGASLKAGIRLALDDAVAKQSPEGIQARYRDSLSHPEYAQKETYELFKSGALIVIGGATSAEAKFMIPEAEKAKGVIISPSASEPGLAASSNLFFRMVPSDDVEGVVAADFLVNQRKTRSILVLYQDGVYANGMLPVFTGEVTKLGAKVTDKLRIGPTDWDKPISEALAASKPDAVFICAFAEETLAALEVVRNAKHPGSVCATSAMITGDVIRRAGALAEGIFVPMVNLDLESQQEPMKSFVKRYKAANKGNAPDLYAAYGYDAAMAALYALQGRPPENTTEILQHLMSLGDKQGVTGKLAFDSGGDILHRPRIHCIRSGKLEDCDPSPVS